MGRSALSRRRHAAATALVTVSLALAGGALPAAPAAAAGELPPWTNPVTLATERTSLQDVAVRSDGTAVALWIRRASALDTGTLYATTRLAGSDAWSAPVTLGAAPVNEAKLVARADGTVAALWVEYPSPTSQGDATGPSRVAAAVLGAGQTAWSAPVELAGTDQQLSFFGLDVAEGPDGTLGAVWAGVPVNAVAATSSEAYATTLGADGSWAAPRKVSNAADYAGPYTGMRVGNPEIASDAQGGLVVSYRMQPYAYGTQYVMTAARPAGTDTWRTPEQITTSMAPLTFPTLSSGPQGVVLVWPGGDKTLQVMRRSGADADWGQAETAATGVQQLEQSPEPLVAPDGDVTLVWADRPTNGLQTTTLDTYTGQWSESRFLSTGYVPMSVNGTLTYDVAMAPDGSVHALWHENGAYQNTMVLMEATRASGTWTAPRGTGNVHEYLGGQIAARSATEVTAAWDWSQSTTTSGAGLEATHTTLPPLALATSSVPASLSFRRSAAWAPTWWTNGAVGSWTLTLTDAAGRTIRTLTGTPGSTKVAASWNGRTDSGAWAVNGKVSWTLKAGRPGAATQTTLASGSVMVAGAAPAFRDFGAASLEADGSGDLLALTATGRLQLRYGTLNSSRDLGTGWPTTIRAVPFGDLSGDRCNDVLVRLSTGALRLYKPACGGALTPTTSYTGLGTGWNQYDVLTSPGDVNRDGRPDLIARNAATGDVYLYKGTGSGTLAARVKLFANWKAYKKLVGAGDLNGDGIGDLLAQDTADNLYRYTGRGDGTYTNRVRIFTGWGGTYNLVLGAGDLTGDGRADLLARDTSGYLYRLPGTGTGTFGARVTIGSGWGTFKGLF